MLQLVQSTLRHQIRVRRASSRSELLHQLQQVQNFLLANVPSLTAHSHKTGWDSAGAASVTALLKLYRSFAKIGLYGKREIVAFNIRQFAHYIVSCLLF